MKAIFIFLIIPLFSEAQTVHVKDERIVYEGKEKAGMLSASEVFNRMQKSLPTIINNYQVDEQSSNSIQAKGVLKLKTPYYLIRTVSYLINVKATTNGYEYRIDSVSFTERQRGERPVTKSSKEVLENMSETGKTVGETERLLNETDMRFQKLLDVIRDRILGN